MLRIWDGEVQRRPSITAITIIREWLLDNKNASIPSQKGANGIKFRVQSKILHVQLQNSASTLSVPGPGSPANCPPASNWHSAVIMGVRRPKTLPGKEILSYILLLPRSTPARCPARDRAGIATLYNQYQRRSSVSPSRATSPLQAS